MHRTRSQRYRAGWLLAGQLALLLGTGVYLLVQQYQTILRDANANALNIAQGMETSIAARFDQTNFSLLGIAEDLKTGERSDAAVEAALRRAARYDPFTSLLAVSLDGRLLAVEIAGDIRRAPPALEQALQARLQPAPAQGLGTQNLLQLPGRPEWFMAVSRRLEGDAGLSLHGLVLAPRIAAGADSLELLRDSRVSLVGLDGSRLLRFTKGQAQLEINGPPVSAERLAQLRAAPRGNLEFFSTIYFRDQIAGYVRSASLPFYVAVIVPVEALWRQWAGDVAGSLLVLLIGLIGVLVFGLRLRHALHLQQQALERAQYLADHDVLTGLTNRDAMLRQMVRAVQEAGNQSIACVLMDIGHFKQINDSCGYVMGDRVLIEIGRRLQALQMGRVAGVSRVGGDELGLWVVGIEGDAAARALAAEMLACLGRSISLDGVELDLTANLGVAVFPADAPDAVRLLRCADIALQFGKAEMQSICRYAPAMDNFSADALALKSDFARALREEGLNVVYQPKLSLHDGRIVGVEALARWTHPQRGVVSPAQFVPLAEHSELIHAFTQHMLALALAQLGRWRAAGLAVPVAVNISVNNLLEPGFIASVQALLQHNGLPAELLELEITESAVMRHAETALQRLHALRAIGVKLSIDDFGTGYASLSYLKQLPVHTLKVDKAFVLALERDEGDQRIVRAAVQLAHGFGMTVVAEGVESAAAVELLRSYGCDAAQGYHFARPMSAAELERQWLVEPARALVSVTAR